MKLFGDEVGDDAPNKIELGHAERVEEDKIKRGRKKKWSKKKKILFQLGRGREDGLWGCERARGISVFNYTPLPSLLVLVIC